MPPIVDFLHYPGQDYKGNPWSNWGDGVATPGKYYSTIGDHKGPNGNAFVYEYDVAGKTLRKILDLRELLNVPEGQYIYTVSKDDAMIYRFDTKTEKVARIAPAPIGTQTYITAVDADPAGRYLYYVPGAHG